MRILCIGPVPPPHTGNSLPVAKLVEALRGGHEVEIISLNKPRHTSGDFSVARLLRIFDVVWRVGRREAQCDAVYLTLAESKLGNLRDLAILFVLRRRLNRVAVHLFGGCHLERLLAGKMRTRIAMNRRLLGRVGAIVVEGATQKRTMERVAPGEAVHVVPNFAEPYLFATPLELDAKLGQKEQLRLLFLSNLLQGKGHRELITACCELPEKLRSSLKFDLAGKTVDPADNELIRRAESALPNFKYHGTVNGPKKRELFVQANVFCLPTYYPYEGQPFSLLEAYASGCAVITTLHSGIPDIFRPGANGIAVEPRRPDQIGRALERMADDHELRSRFGVHNWKEAGAKYSEARFLSGVCGIIQERLSDGDKRSGGDGGGF